MVVDTAMYTIHTAFAALWSGSVLFVVAAVLPLAMDGELEPDAFGSVVSKLQWVTRVSALLMLVSGGHLAGTGYTVGSLTGTTRGYLVLVMVALWLGLAAAVEIGSARAQRGIDERKIREPARNARPFYLGASLLAVGLLVVSGLLGMPPAFL
ncbi:transporter [Halobacteriales archaeon QH_10_70_21]|jgi:hypothetical protein|nr:MAG: transporter [Halobacteriales archaeon QH_10_70_21]